MKKVFKIIILVFILFALVLTLLFMRFRHLMGTERVEKMLVDHLEYVTEASLDYERFEMSFFPTPRAVFTSPDFSSTDTSHLSASEMRLKLSVPHLLIGKIRIASTRLGDGEFGMTRSVRGKEVRLRLSDILFKTGSVKPDQPLEVYFECSYEGIPKAIEAKGYLRSDARKNIRWHDFGFDLEINFQTIPLRGNENSEWAGILFKTAGISGSARVRKNLYDGAFQVSLTSSMKQLNYELWHQEQLRSIQLDDVPLRMDAVYHLGTEELRIEKSSATLPFVTIEATGEILLEEKKFQPLRLNASGLELDQFPQYLPHWMEKLPLYIGFSGKSDLSLSLEGDESEMNVYVDWDLTQALLTYGKYFNKPKEVPFHAGFDGKVTGLEVISGDISSAIENLSIKGSLTNFYFHDRKGQMNLITNKFALEILPNYIPVLKNYELGGVAKILFNWKGNLSDETRSESVYHISLDKASLVRNGKGIRDASFSIDYGILLIEGKDLAFTLGDAPVKLDLTVYRPHGDTKAEAVLESESMNPSKAWESIAALLTASADSKEALPPWAGLLKNVSRFFPSEDSIGDVRASFRYEEDVAKIEDFRFTLMEGEVAMRGELLLNQEKPTYWWELQAQDIDFGRYVQDVTGEALAAELVDGKLNFKAFFDGKGWGSEAWMNELTGSGKFTLTDGNSFLDFPGTLSRIKPFEDIKDYTKDGLAFDLLDFDWKFEAARFMSSNFLIRNSDFVADGDGTVGLDGMLNFRFETYLSPELSSKMFPRFYEELSRDSDIFMGPIPVLLTGSVTEPGMRVDPSAVPSIVTKIASGKKKDIFYRLILD